MPGVRRRRVLLVPIAVLVAAGSVLPACGRSRADYQTEFKVLVESRGQLAPEEVDCVMDGFFGEMTDGEARAFARRDELTDQEAASLQSWASRCRWAD